MKLIDTHAHIAHGRLYQQVDSVLDRAAAAGVVATICAVGDLAESKTALGLARKYASQNVFWITGIHPHEAKDAPAETPRILGELYAKERCVGIGEIGLDYHYDFSPRPRQREVFATQLEVAKNLSAAIIIHTREAFDETMEILRSSGVDGSRVIFHSFTGGEDEVRTVLDFGAAVSFSGIVTFKSAADIQRAALLVPDDRILVETDCPYLSPEPMRKMKTNEPANVAHVAAFLANLRNTPPENFARGTTENAIRLFNLNLS
ncbi:MAG: TatD family hydrolase [Phycisphaerae bacterium]|nr:TatD family hydrolase [Phycisphaerae bacterium]